MANASGLFTPSVPSLRRRVHLPISIYRSGFCSSEGMFKRVLCSSTIEGSEKSVSPSESRLPRFVSKGCKLVGCGSAVPTLQISNDDLAKVVETSDEWISTRTGVRNRRVLSGKESLNGLAVEAARKALQMAEVEPDDVDLVLMCTSTPEDLFGGAPQGCILLCILGMLAHVNCCKKKTREERKEKKRKKKKEKEEENLNCRVPTYSEGPSQQWDVGGDGFDSMNMENFGILEIADLSLDEPDLEDALFNSTASGSIIIQKALGCKHNPLAYDITAACSGFVLGLVSAASHIRGTGFRNVLVIGADALSRFVDWTDRGTCILFGDAAGAVLLQACDGEEDGLFSFDVHSDGEGGRHLNAGIRGNETEDVLGSNGSVLFPPQRSSYSCIHMNGKEVFRFAVRVVPQSIESAMSKAGLTMSSIDWLLLHQANQRILDAVATRLEVPSERVISNLANYGNTSAASIPLALDEAVRSGKVKSGHTIAAAGFGAGLTWGSVILRWG
ncbi:hypothetical protein JRO89_XS13G0053000 [Xanthoceras sorbifolium]|uniref:Uncharacterized protein n=1 Tax=Xanthoceras sorbifolium TaxID=99658 RepID=A0ABQ8H6Q8_9ROSI|nr:hypothetical protein JRO89_XS13G0053000 [Xanthoceras sorbifolium]